MSYWLGGRMNQESKNANRRAVSRSHREAGWRRRMRLALEALEDRLAPAAASQFLISGLPASTNVAAPQSFTVTAEDSSGQVVTDDAGTVQLTSSDPTATIQATSSDASLSLPADFTFTSGDLGTFTFTPGITFGTAGTQRSRPPIRPTRQLPAPPRSASARPSSPGRVWRRTATGIHREIGAPAPSPVPPTKP